MARKVKQAHGGSITLAQKGDVLNPKGPTPKLLSTITAELKAKGYERATANQVADAFETLMNVPQNELADMVKDEKAPMSLRIVGKAMLTAKGWEVLQAMLDRAHGKAKQAIDHTSDGKAIAPTSIAITREVVTRKV
jgi:hypothetical protein